MPSAAKTRVLRKRAKRHDGHLYACTIALACDRFFRSRGIPTAQRAGFNPWNATENQETEPGKAPYLLDSLSWPAARPVLFDLLWSHGRDITGKTVLQRRERLEQLIAPVSGIQVGGYVENRGKDLFQLAKEKGFEGVIAKRKASVYRPGKRSPDWLKIKSRPQQEFVICGFTEGKGSRKYFGALLLCAYRNGKLRYFGHSGTGFSEKAMRETIDRLKPFFTDKPPVENPPKIPEKIQWVKPALVCEVAFAEWTQDGERQTTFLGWRDDKNPREVVL
jgi:bifunctional non-homologous end joining protein LigD